MAKPTARLCGGHLLVEFDARSTYRDNHLVVVLTNRRASWDGEPISDVVAEALSVAWYAAEDD